ncbi:carboxypeptidase regulatory-like domain-containing protein, partial [Streptomyces sp. SID10244]|nr:carboxypeptidase regulatory-like domain-containing protein [Streptomyces sp. SID10244]
PKPVDDAPISGPRHRLDSTGEVASRDDRPRIAGRITADDGTPLGTAAITVTDTRGHQAGTTAVHADGTYTAHDIA